MYSPLAFVGIIFGVIIWATAKYAAWFSFYGLGEDAEAIAVVITRTVAGFVIFFSVLEAGGRLIGLLRR